MNTTSTSTGTGTSGGGGGPSASPARPPAAAAAAGAAPDPAEPQRVPLPPLTLCGFGLPPDTDPADLWAGLQPPAAVPVFGVPHSATVSDVEAHFAITGFKVRARKFRGKWFIQHPPGLVPPRISWWGGAA
ncbi:hypothetical protein Pelo_19374 [Pelomyxa schiedti]|nr:hypothetical protein Pelo_19374 [Pelomyxa schiedti]